MYKLKMLLMVSVATFLLINIVIANPAQAITFNYTWKGDAGYSAQGSFSYDETKGYSVITSAELDFLKISFFNPVNELLKTYINIKNGKNTGNNSYIEFNFNPINETFFNDFDIGEGNQTGVNDFYLHGVIDSKLELRNLDLNVLDKNSGFIAVQKIAVPESSSVILSN